MCGVNDSMCFCTHTSQSSPITLQCSICTGLGKPLFFTFFSTKIRCAESGVMSFYFIITKKITPPSYIELLLELWFVLGCLICLTESHRMCFVRRANKCIMEIEIRINRSGLCLSILENALLEFS